MSQEHSDPSSTLVPVVPFDLLPPIIEASETAELVEISDITQKETSASQPSVVTKLGKDQSKAVEKKPAPSVIMDVGKKKEAENKLIKLMEGRLEKKKLRQQDSQQVKASAKENKAHANEEKCSKSAGDENIKKEETGVSENEPTVRTDLVREADADDKDEYPEEGLTKDLLTKFQKIAAEADITKRKEHQPSKIVRKPTGAGVVRTRGHIDASHFVDADDDGEASGGVFESQPIIRTDVVKENDRNDDEELPPPGLTRSLLSAFYEIGNSGENTPTMQRSRAGSGASGKLRSHPLRISDREASYSENEPTVRENVVRETDAANELAELPAQGVTKGLLSMFSQVSESAEKMKEKLHKPSGVARKRWKPKNRKVEEPKEVEREVVRETTEVVVVEELPKSGQAENLLRKFKSMETTRTGSVYQHAWSASKTTKSESLKGETSEPKEGSAAAKEGKGDACLEASGTIQESGCASLKSNECSNPSISEKKTGQKELESSRESTSRNKEDSSYPEQQEVKTRSET